MKVTVIRNLILASLLAIMTPTLRSQDAEKPKDSSCPSQECDWLTRDAERLQALAAKDTSPTFSLTLTSKSPEYRIGSVLWIKIAQTNLTNHDIDCSSVWDGIDRSYEYQATDEDGKAVEKRHRGTESYDHGCSMAIGENVPSEIQLERVFKFDRPGKYVIRVSRPEPFVKDEKGEPAVIWSNPITINITG